MPNQNGEQENNNRTEEKKLSFNYSPKLPKVKGGFRGALKGLVLVGLLMILQNEGAFESYPAVNDFVTAILSIVNWCYAIMMHIINWVASLEFIRWLAELPF